MRCVEVEKPPNGDELIWDPRRNWDAITLVDLRFFRSKAEVEDEGAARPKMTPNTRRQNAERNEMSSFPDAGLELG